MGPDDTTIGRTPYGVSGTILNRTDRVEEVRPSGWDLSNCLRLPLQRFLTQCVPTPYCRKCLVPCGEDLRVRQQIVEHVLAWTDDNHTFALSQCQAKLNVAPTGRKDRVRYLGKNNDRISCHEVFACRAIPQLQQGILRKSSHRDVTVSPIESNCSRYPQSSTRRAYLAAKWYRMFLI
jgi:hypothetical protein